MDREYAANLVRENGEVHFVVEEHSAVAGSEKIGVRNNNEYKFKDECLVIDSKTKVHHIPYDRIVYAELPKGEWPD